MKWVVKAGDLYFSPGVPWSPNQKEAWKFVLPEFPRLLAMALGRRFRSNIRVVRLKPR
jgi:hypothetical protein